MTQRIHWSAVLPIGSEHAAGRSAAMALAHARAYGRAVTEARTREARREADDRHGFPAQAAFSFAASLHGWGVDKIKEALEDGGVEEWCPEWLTEAGVATDVIERLGCDLNADALEVEAAKLSIKVTVEDTETGESQTRELADDYAIICAGSAYRHAVNVNRLKDGTETHIITVKGIRQ